MTYYSDIKFFNGLSFLSLLCYTALLCLHQCLLHTPCALCSFSFYALCTTSLHHTIPLLYISTVMLCLLLHTSITPNNNHHFFFVQHYYSLYAPCACNLLLSLASSPPPISSTSGCFLHFTPPLLSHLLCATLSLSVLHLLPIVSALPDHHGNSSASLAVETLHLLCHRRAHPLAETIICF
jgi:hypothetical protein